MPWLADVPEPPSDSVVSAANAALPDCSDHDFAGHFDDYLADLDVELLGS